VCKQPPYPPQAAYPTCKYTIVDSGINTSSIHCSVFAEFTVVLKYAVVCTVINSINTLVK
jgi:hypothetical protein